MSTDITASFEQYISDTIHAKDGGEFRIIFFKHASFAIEVDGRYIYIDPVDSFADYASMPKADLILITHSHYDHLDCVAINKLHSSATDIICDKTSGEQLNIRCKSVSWGDKIAPREYLDIEVVAAYNTTEGHLDFHPKQRGDNGYILTILGTRIYISGDSEATSEMRLLHNIDIAFLAVNQPYTMAVDEAIEIIKEMHPVIFYPYHYGQVDEVTDIDKLVRGVESVTDVRIRQMQ